MSDKAQENHEIKWRGAPPPVTRADLLRWEDGPENDPPPVVYRLPKQEGSTIGKFFRKIIGTK